MPDFASRSDARTSCVLFPIDETMPIPVTTTRLIEKRSSADPFPWRGFILRSRGQRYPIGRAKARRLPLGCRGRDHRKTATWPMDQAATDAIYERHGTDC